MKDRPIALTPKLRFPEFAGRPGWNAVNGDELFDPIDRRPAAAGLPVLAITQEHGAIPRDDIDYRVSVTEASIATYKEVQPGDFIISLRSFQGGIEYSRFHGICSPAYLILKRKGIGCDDFFRHLFKSDRFIRQLTRNIEGIRDGKMISYKQFAEQLLPVPDPTEQLRIAECLTSLDEWIAAEGRELAGLRAHRKGLMQELFPQKGETRPRIRFPEFLDAPDWVTVRLGEYFETMTGGTPDRTKKEYWDGTIPWITTSLVDFNVIDETDEFITEAGLRNSSAKLFPKGTVLIALYGQGKTRGQVALLDIEAATNQACAAILPVSGFDPVFTFLSLSGRYEEMRSLSNAGGQENLSQGLIRELPFYYPDDPAERERIAACLCSLDALISAQSRKLDALRAHKKGLTQRLFPSPERV
ncbi:MAG TPA: restriction endonuclease subunit S [Fimbriimonas sp.]|nr:restriction endonuclease subunit S [Fimbriimonas sp.]